MGQIGIVLVISLLWQGFNAFIDFNYFDTKYLVLVLKWLLDSVNIHKVHLFF